MNLSEGFIQALGSERTRGTRLKGVLRVVLTAALGVWFFRLGVWPETLRSLGHLNLAWFGSAVLLYLAGQSLCAWKWGILAAGQGFRRSLAFYWSVYLGAMFPSLFLPTSISGDVFRVLALTRAPDENDRAAATVSVLADRGTGVLAMACICMVVTAAGGARELPAAAVQAIWLIGSLLLVFFTLPFAFLPWLRRDRLVPTNSLATLRGRLETVVRRVLRCWQDPRGLLTALAAAVLFQGLMGAIYLCLGMAMGLTVPALFYFILAPVAALAAVSPITINGLGERMAALVLLFGAVGIGREQAVGFGLEWTALAAVTAVVGGLIFLIVDPMGSGTALRNSEIQ